MKLINLILFFFLIGCTAQSKIDVIKTPNSILNKENAFKDFTINGYELGMEAAVIKIENVIAVFPSDVSNSKISLSESYKTTQEIGGSFILKDSTKINVQYGTIQYFELSKKQINLYHIESEQDIELKFGKSYKIENSYGNITYHYLNRNLKVVWNTKKNEIFRISIGTVNKIDLLDAGLIDAKDVDIAHVTQEHLEKFPESLRSYSNLKELVIGSKKLVVIPSWIGSLEQLEYLDLSSNLIQALPDEIGNLKKLKILNLFSNQLIELNPAIGNCSSLKQLLLNNNKLKEIPDEIGKLTELTSLDIFENELEAIPESIGNLTQLEWLAIYTNKIKELPNSIGNLESLAILSAAENELLTLPNVFQNLDKLRILAIDIPKDKKLPLSLNESSALTKIYLKHAGFEITDSEKNALRASIKPARVLFH